MTLPNSMEIVEFLSTPSARRATVDTQSAAPPG